MIGKFPGAIAGFLAGFGGVSLVGTQAGDAFMKACDAYSKDNYANDMATCDAITQ